MPTIPLHTVTVGAIDPVPVTLTSRGDGRPILLLHGGMGPESMSTFAELLADNAPVRVYSPIHPGYGGTPRPERLNSIRGLAALYVELLELLDLTEVTVIGNSLGGWTTAEIAALGSPRVRDVVLIDAVGLDVPEHPPANFFGLTPEQAAAYAYHDPGSFLVDPSTLTPEQVAAMAANRETMRVYVGGMSDPGLPARLATITVPTVVLWGESDRVVTPEYGRAYAAAIPGARFELLPATGHAPQIESPMQLLDAIRGLTTPA